jgi:lipooligosaccharide transport system permease protein
VSPYAPVFHWQSWAVLGRHVRVHLRKWHVALLPPVFDPLIMLTAFGLGLGRQMGGIEWGGRTLDYLTYLAPGVLAYTAFMTAFFQSLFTAYFRMHFQKAWEGQLTTQIRLEHVVWGEVLWAATMSTAYSAVVCVLLSVYGAAGWIGLHWAWLPCTLPLLFLAALAFASLGLLFTAMLPSMDHMSLPFFLVILPLAVASNTYFPLPDVPGLREAALLNPLQHLADGLRALLVDGKPTASLAFAAGLSALILLVLVPVDLRKLRRRVFGDA